MNRSIIVLIFTLLIATVSGQVKNQRDASGRKQGYWEAVDRSGKLVYTGTFRNDKPEGELKRYYSDGGVRVIMFYDDKSEKVRARFFWKNGEPAASGNYINTRRDSVWTYYSYYSKTVSYRVGYITGMRNGKAQSFYPNGTVAEEINWIDDKKNGLWKQFFENGQLKLSGTYKNDLLNGTFTVYYPDGKKETEGAYRNDMPDSDWIHYDSDGKTVSTIKYADGEITNIEELEAAEQEFFKKLEEQKGTIKEPTIEDLIRDDANKK